MNQPNPGKQLSIETAFGRFDRFPVRTHVAELGEDYMAFVERYVRGALHPGDIVAVSEKVIAICQRRSYPIDEIKPGALARFLVRFVHKSKHGIGLGMDCTMQLAIDEVGPARILFAALVSALTKPFGLRGVFYHIVGRTVASIDGPTPYTLPPYNRYAKLGPRDPHGVARELSARLGSPVAVIDANDLGVEVLGASDRKLVPLIKACFRDNPLGQGSEQTPIAIIRKS